MINLLPLAGFTAVSVRSDYHKRAFLLKTSSKPLDHYCLESKERLIMVGEEPAL
jgi:hypothetical protein